MSTQVATSHTVHTRAPLRVPKRPPRNDVSVAIQKFLPYAVVFLLSLIIYTSFHSSPVTYPPYSPPGMGETEPSQDMLNYARDNINRRSQRLEELKRMSDEQVGDAKRYKAFKEEKAEELRRKIEASEMQMNRGLKKGMDYGKHAKDVAKEGVEEMKVNAGKKIIETKDFAYDAIYAWKQNADNLKESGKEAMEKAAEVGSDSIQAAQEKLGEIKESVQSKLEDVVERAKETIQDVNADTLKAKSVEAWEAIQQTAERTGEAVKNAVGEDVIESVKEKLSEAKDAASEKAKEVINSARDTVQGLVGQTETVSEAATRRISQAEYDFLRRHMFPLSPQHNATLWEKLSNLVDRVKAGLVEDEHVRQALSMQAEWAKIDFNHKTEMIVQQLRLMGDDVVQEVVRRLGGYDRCNDKYEHTQMCPK